MRAGKGIAALGAALLIASSAAADYKDSYSRGLEAAKDGDWATVRQRMQDAIADNPAAAPRVRLYGQRWEPYVPQFYLGLAAFNQGDCATALAQWRSAANSGVIGSVPNLKAEQDRASAKCDTRVAQTDKPNTDKPATSGGNQAPDGGKTEVPKPPPKTDPAKPEPPKPEPPKPEPKPPVTPPKPVETPLAQRVPAPLLEAFRNYLAGRYADAARIDPNAYSDGRAKSQAYLIRAAARQRQAEIDNSDAGLEAARSDIRALRALNPALVPDAALFSPRFRSFYSSTR
ncbi:hypothetical protein DFR29_103211 [Tahibacter aquaticus]|uniref:Tetratricopeptide repeat protein n=1 Tax=Tahibacter aquaticus TaxID=520092 RepID=A0A4R6Z4R7_9GAMM|nr:hypothetical protein [Tahibacter aquaticus]TDR46675.1 hypothetical protein DFR29_103211 [Tahibacter aquaticus]